MNLLAFLLLCSLVGLVGAGLVYSSRTRNREQEEALESLAAGLGARLSTGHEGRRAAFFEKDGRSLEIQYEPTEEWTCLLLHLEETEAPEIGNFRIFLRGATRLEDLAERPRVEGALHPEVETQFKVHSRAEDKAFLHHLLDPAGRQLLKDLAQLHGKREAAVLEYLAGARILRVRAPGYLPQPRSLDRLLTLGIQMVRRVSSRSSEGSPPPPAASLSMEV